MTSCKKGNEIIPDPVTTTPGNIAGIAFSGFSVTNITDASAQAQATVFGQSGYGVSSRGFVISTHQNPTIADTKIISGTGSGSFSVSIPDLSPYESYYLRAFATDANGTSYSNETNFTADPIQDAAKTILVGGTDTLYSLQAATGNLKWKIRLGSDVTGIAYAKGKIFTTTASNQLFCHDTTGLLKWSIVIPGTLLPQLPVAANDLVYIPASGGLYAFNASNGSIVWTLPTGVNANNIQLSNNRVFAESNQQVKAVNASTGSEIWSSDNLRMKPIPFCNGSIAYFVTGSTYRAVNATTGITIWDGPDVVLGSSLPSISSGYSKLYIYGAFTHLYAIKISDGSQAWVSSSLASSYGKTPVLQKDKVLLSTATSVIIYDPRTGLTTGSFGATTGAIADDITCMNNIAYIAYRNSPNPPAYARGQIFAWDINSGLPIWASQHNEFSTTPCVITASDKMHRGNQVY